MPYAERILSFILSVLPNWLAVLLMAVDLCGRKKKASGRSPGEIVGAGCNRPLNSQVLAPPVPVNATELR